MTLSLPYQFEPREYQLPLMRAIDAGCTRAVVVWHRRSGKDMTCVNIIAKKMLERVGTYYYFFPTYNQGRKILWDGIDEDGKKMLDHFPAELLEGTPNNTEMKLRYKNSSLFQIVGADKIDSVVGTNPIFCVFSEFSLMNPRAWSFIRPILAKNGGAAIFVFTPRGENHAFDMFNLAANDPAWFCQVLTVDDTQIMKPEVLVRERREILQQDGNDSLFQQEYYCDFSVPIAGAYYAEQITQAYRDGRITNVPHDERHTVDTWWDIGVDDSTTIWFTQTVGMAIHVIDYEEDTGHGLPHYVKLLQDKGRDLGYVYGIHTGPHDLRARDWSATEWQGQAARRIQTARGLGLEFRVAPKIALLDGIDVTRALLSKCYFDRKRCERGINSLKNYRKEYDQDKKTYLKTPVHDWASHGADGLRTMGVTYNARHSKQVSADRMDDYQNRRAEPEINVRPMAV